jgi:hypothetical protein
VKKKLLASGKDEIVSAVDALENFIDELHTHRSPAALQRYRSVGTEPLFTCIVNESC